MRIGADVGGTFTDVVSIADDGTFEIAKVLSTPPNYDAGVVDGIGQLGAQAKPSEVVHGTTVATNAVLERRGARTAMVTTAGFRDVLELRRLRLPKLYDPFWVKPPPIIERALRFEVLERIRADGSVEVELDLASLEGLAERLRAEAVSSVAVCLINSYVNPDHERRVGESLRRLLPECSVSLSIEILREQGEYERSATAAVNAYVQPIMNAYLGRLEDGISADGRDVPLLIMQSSGGLMTSDDARSRPVFALESGPAAGVIAAAGISRALALSNVIAFDMGGTTAKASLIENGEISRAREYEVGGSLSAGSRLLRGAGELLRLPSIDIAEVGAGGGSIAWVDAGGGLNVGPQSAGATPGPVCYGLGGTEPTVTDANVVLGYIRAAAVADGAITIDREAAGECLTALGSGIGMNAEELAFGIHQIANSRMMRALRSVSSERGRDPREFALVAYGGSGPIHAAGLAEDLGVRTVVVPEFAGLFSAVGLLFGRPEAHEVRVVRMELAEVDFAAAASAFEEMEQSLSQTLRLDGSEISYARSAELRYVGQSWNIEVPFRDHGLTKESLRALAAAFEDEHERLYGVRGSAGSSIVIRSLRVTGSGPEATRGRRQLQPPETETGEVTRTCLFRGQAHEVPVIARSVLTTSPTGGPLLIDEYDTTIVVPPGWSAQINESTRAVLLERDGA
jgi:N-methylhydantoinase A